MGLEDHDADARPATLEEETRTVIEESGTPPAVNWHDLRNSKHWPWVSMASEHFGGHFLPLSKYQLCERWI
jgi:hypothetical protein